MTGRVLGGRYLAEQLLGSGGMAAVWRGRDLRLDRPVAIKELAGSGLSDPVAKHRFDREARTVARLAHPNIVAVHDFGTEDGHPYLVMELVEGHTVAALLGDGPLPVDRTVALAAQVCEGLTAAHTAGVIHRDIKPGNLIVTPAGIVKICDFGIARAQQTADQSSLTAPAIAMGSTSFMAPEQAVGDPVDGRTDLYSLGCTMYAMLAGAPPFTGDAMAIMHQHVTRPPVPLRTLRADLPPELELLINRLLAKNPADRPANAAEVKAELAALPEAGAAMSVPTAVVRPVAAPGVPDAGPTQPVNLAGGPPRERRWRWALAAGAVLATLVLIPVLGATGPRDRGAAPVPPPAGVAGASSAAPSAASALGQPSLPGSPVERNTNAEPSVRPSRSAVPSVAASPVDPIVAIRLSVRTAVDTGNLTPAAAGELYKKVDEVARELNEGDTGEAAKKIDEMRHKLADYLRDGKVSQAGYDVLIADVDRLAALIA